MLIFINFLLAIDTEFTGLHLENNKPRLQIDFNLSSINTLYIIFLIFSLIDTADQRYKKLKKSVQTFNVVQIGLCTFRYCSEQKMYEIYLRIFRSIFLLII